MDKGVLGQRLYWGQSNDWSSYCLSVFCLSVGLSSTSCWQIFYHFFILPSAVSWELEPVTAFDILRINLYSRVSTNTYYCVLKILIRNAVWYVWYFHVVSAAILLILRLVFFKINYSSGRTRLYWYDIGNLENSPRLSSIV